MKSLFAVSFNLIKNIVNYAAKIMSDYPNIINQEIKLIEKGITIKPFDNWNVSSPSQSLFWWGKYNDVKHGRIKNYKDANLKNVLYSLAGLLILENLWLKKITKGTNEPDIPRRKSEIFELVNWTTKYSLGNEMLFERNGSTLNMYTNKKIIITIMYYNNLEVYFVTPLRIIRFKFRKHVNCVAFGLVNHFRVNFSGLDAPVSKQFRHGVKVNSICKRQCGE